MDVIAKGIADGEMITENALCHRTSVSVTGPVEYKKPFYVAREGVDPSHEWTLKFWERN